MPRRKQERDVRKEAWKLIWELLGIWHTNLKAFGENGLPDHIYWLPGGKPLLIEFKLPGEEPREKQKEIHKKLEELGYQVHICTSSQEALATVITSLETRSLSKAGRKVLAAARRRCALL